MEFARVMRRFFILAATLLPLLGGVAVDHADARLGGGHSLGSRGSFTYRPPRPTSIAPGAAPFERSQAPSAGYNANRAFGTPGGSFAQRRPFLTGLMGGFIGAGIFGLLFGHGFMHMGGGFGGLFGVLLQLILLYFVIRWLFRLFARPRVNQPSIFGPVGGAQPTGGAGYGGIGAAQAAAGPSVQTLQLTPADRQAFAQCLTYVQEAWGAGDMRAISQAATPELVGYFQEQLNTLARQGLRNRVSDVRIEGMDLSEAWSEGDIDYATVAIRFSMIDVTEDRSGRIVDGDPNVRALVNEIWTFTRRRGSHWIPSAIQQTS
jgi:predicted lipid-binding transport protein (Tim44 family)